MKLYLSTCRKTAVVSIKVKSQVTLLLIPLIGVILAGNAYADTRLVTLNNSYHFKRDGQNEVHSGIGVEHKVGDLWLGVTRFKNSDRNKSTLLSAQYEAASNINGLYYGFAIGRASNYDQSRNRTFATGTIRYRYLKLMVTPRLISVGAVIEF